MFVTFLNEWFAYSNHTGLVNLTYQSTTYGNKVTTLTNDRYAIFSIPKANKATAVFRENITNKVISVGKEIGCMYTSIQSAINAANDGDTIEVYPGDYMESVDATGKLVYLEGYNRDTCRIISTDNRRDYPALEMVKGSARNLTFWSKRLEGASFPAYATPYGAHIDYDLEANQTLKFDNCVFRSDWNAGVGIGMRDGFNLSFNRCEMITNYTLGGIFFHDSSNEVLAGTYYLTLDSCRIKTLVNGRFATVMGIGYEGNDLQLTLINNMFWSPNYKKLDTGINSVAPDSPHPSSTGTKWLNTNTITLTENSYGNNIAICNASTYFSDY